MGENILSCERLESARDLGNSADSKLHSFYVGITLNYSPTFIFSIRINGRKRRISWGAMTPDQQRDIFIEHLKNIHAKHYERIWYTFELTKDGQLHCHAMGLILEDKPEHKEFNLTMIRKTVSQDSEVIRYCKGVYKKTITSNYIHYVDKDKWDEYIKKDLNKTPYSFNTMSYYSQKYD